MKNVNTIINAVLGAAVIALFILYFTDGDSATTSSSEAGTATNRTTITGPAAGSMAYFKVDSVLENWELYAAMQEEMAGRQSELEADFEGKSQSFMKRVEDAQYKMQRGLVTRAEAEQLQQQLAEEEQGLLGLQNNYTMQLQEEGVVKNRQMIDKIEQYLKEYNADKGYSFIFSYSFGGNLLYGDEALDITNEVIEGINETYPVEK